MFHNEVVNTRIWFLLGKLHIVIEHGASELKRQIIQYQIQVKSYLNQANAKCLQTVLSSVIPWTNSCTCDINNFWLISNPFNIQQVIIRFRLVGFLSIFTTYFFASYLILHEFPVSKEAVQLLPEPQRKCILNVRSTFNSL